MSESELMRSIQIALSKAGHRVFRNNIGTCMTSRGDYLRYGVCNPGGADLIGWTKDGRFLAVEVKGPKGKLTNEQTSFLNAINNIGGVGICAKSLEDIRII